MRPPARPLALLLSLLGFSMAAAAETGPSTPGELRVTGPGGTVVELPLRHTKVGIEVTAFVARATIEQVFANPFTEPIEAVYTFPLGHDAAVDDFELVAGDRTIRGEIKRRDAARAAYEQARASGYQAALLEQERPNIFTQSVANLEPGKTITVRLRTVETLRYERGFYRLTFPLVVGPRYIPGGSVTDAAHIAPPVLKPGTRSGHDVDIAVTIDAGVPLANLESPSHRVAVRKTSARAAAVSLADDDTIPNKDFLLRWSVSSEKPALGFLAHRDGLDGFFTLLVQPKGEIGPTEAMPKEITFVLDTSGSMSGIPLEASKRLAAKALRALGPRDTFNLIRFAGDNEVYAKQSLGNDLASIEAALTWLNRQSGGGGTELLRALEAAFVRPADPNRLRVVVFLTDGYVGNEAEILAAIGKVVGDARIYTIGIGSSVNHYLLASMADLGRGAYVFVRPDESADDALEAFRSWVTLPYVTDLSIDWGSLAVADLAPERIPDLGSGQTLSVVGRYLKAGDGNVVVRGKIGGRYFEQTLRVSFPERETRHDALSSLWARARIGALLRDAGNPVPPSTEAAVTDLALSYRLMSPFTSFVAIDDSRVVNPTGNPATVRQALPMPESVSFEGVFGKDGPRGLRANVQPAQQPLETSDAESDELQGGVEGGVPGGVVGGVSAGVMMQAPVVQLDRAVAARAKAEPASADGDGNPNVHGARAREFKALTNPVAGDARLVRDGTELLLDSAFRVLADLADDGVLSPAEGKPALAALLAAQSRSGAISDSVPVHAAATWALAEAARSLPNDAWVRQAQKTAADYLIQLREPTGWPARAHGAVDAEATRWARLVLGWVAPTSVPAVPMPAGEPSRRYTQLRAAIAAAASGAAPPASTGSSAFERLVRSIGRGNLKLVNV